MINNLSALIKKIESYYPLPDSEKNKLKEIVKEKKLAKNDFFVRAGEYSDTIAYMGKGLIRYYYIGPSGKEFTRYFCQGDSFVSSYSALVTGEPSSYFIQAMYDTELLYFSYKNWLMLAESNPIWGQITVKIQDYALLLSEERERSLIMDDAKTRYLKFLDRYPGIEEEVKQYDIASYLGITPVALSRIRGEMK